MHVREIQMSKEGDEIIGGCRVEVAMLRVCVCVFVSTEK